MKDPFTRKGKRNPGPEAEIKTLQAKIGELIEERPHSNLGDQTPEEAYLALAA